MSQETIMADGPDEDYALKLAGEGISIEKKVSKQVAMAVLAAVASGGAVAAAVERVEADGQQRRKPPPSLREFLAESRASTNAVKITALGRYVCHYEGKENFSNDDIKEGFRRAREAIPKNISRDIGTAIKANLIAEAPGKAGRYYVTQKGAELVDTTAGRSE
jgi:hypothetical protein